MTRDELITQHAGLAYVHANRYAGLQPADRADLIAHLLWRMSEAGLNYDPRRGTKPSTWFLAALRYGALEWFRTRDGMTKTAWKALRDANHPDHNRIASLRNPVPIHALAVDKDGVEFGDLADPAQDVEGVVVLRVRVQEALADLTTRQQLVARRLWIEGRTAREVAAEVGLSASRIWQEAATAAARLREALAK